MEDKVMKTILTIEESQRLIDLGVDPKLASMKEFVPIHPEVLKGNAEYAKPWGWFPKFRLEDILSILPKEINGYHLNIEASEQGYEVCYKLWDTYHFMGATESPELIDALYSLLIWCLESNIIKLKKD